jgi:hypothetical protein
VLSPPPAAAAAAAAGVAAPKRAAFFIQQPPATIEDAYRRVKSGTATAGGFPPLYQDCSYPYHQQQQQQQQPEGRSALLAKLLAVRANWRPGVIISDRVAASAYNKAAAMSRAAAALAATSAYAAARAKAYAEGRWVHVFRNLDWTSGGRERGGGGLSTCIVPLMLNIQH